MEKGAEGKAGITQLMPSSKEPDPRKGVAQSSEMRVQASGN